MRERALTLRVVDLASSSRSLVRIDGLVALCAGFLRAMLGGDESARRRFLVRPSAARVVRELKGQGVLFGQGVLLLERSL